MAHSVMEEWEDELGRRNKKGREHQRGGGMEGGKEGSWENEKVGKKQDWG
jgi:hypothetical protein